jgi:hypothetical protein
MAKAFPNTGATTGLAADRSALTGMFAGQQFFETDTKDVYVYTGSAWVKCNDFDNAYGIVIPDASWRVVGASGQPGFVNSWYNYGNGYTPARFKKDITNTVFIEGLVAGGSSTIFTLPSGYAPTGGSLILSTVTNPNIIGRLEIATSGTVSMSVGNNGWFSICCSFKAE